MVIATIGYNEQRTIVVNWMGIQTLIKNAYVFTELPKARD